MILFDTAESRLAIDEPLMQELSDIDRRVHPANILLIVDAMIGQDAVGTAKAFNDRLNLDGVILTKLDGDARGGAALSVKAVTGKPIKFVGMGESSDRLEEFRPDGMASRILGRGDVVGLVQQFEEVVDEERHEQDAMRMLKGKFDMNDFLEQIGVLKKMGPLKEMMEEASWRGRGDPGGRPGRRPRAGPHHGHDLVDDRRRAAPPRNGSSSPAGRRSSTAASARRSAAPSTTPAVSVASPRAPGHKEQEVADLLNRFGMMRQMMMQIGMSTGLLGKIPGFGAAARAGQEADGHGHEPAGQHDADAVG